MEAVCENCQTVLNIPDNKIPNSDRLIVRCPKCKNKISIYTRSPGREDDVPEMENRAETPKDNIIKHFEEKDIALDSFKEGEKLALIVESDNQFAGAITQAASELEYRCISAQTTQEAINEMRFLEFSLLIVSDKFLTEHDQSPILAYLNNLTIDIRRKIFLVLIGSSFKTMDKMAAFHMSANLVINRNDLGQLTNILKYSIMDNERFYKVLLDCLSEAGRL